MQSSKILLKDGQIVDLVDGRINDGDIDTWNNKLNVEITSPNGTINVQSSTDVQTNTKTFDISVNTDIVATNKDVSGLEDKINYKLDSKEDVSNKIQVVNDSSTTEYPSSKAVANFVNSSVATNTATFLGNFSLDDLGLTYPATEVQIATALNSHTWPSGYPTNNDYVYVEIRNPQSSIYDKVQRYKYRAGVASWGYEYTLNNSSFTSEEMAAIDSGVTSQDVTNLRSDHTTLESHVSNTSNPHKVTKSQVGLGNVDNTRDADKPVSTAQQNALNKKLDNTGDASNTTASFTKNSGDTSSVTSGGKLSAIFTAISSFFASLKALAFKDKVTDSDISGTVSDSHIASSSNWNSKASGTHTHGNIQNGGALQTTDITIADSDKLVVTDASDSNKVARASLTFDGATTDQMLSKKGEWSDTIAKARAVVDYAKSSDAIEIGWAGASVTSLKHFAVYTDSEHGYKKAIKDCTLETVKKVINGTSVGSTAVPVFINANGDTQVCTDDFVHDGDVTSTYSSTGTAPVNGKAIAAAIGGLDSNLAAKADKANNLTGATKCKITYNSQGIVTAGNDLSASDIPNLAASKITSGTFGTDRIADDAITAAKVKANETLPVNVSGRAGSATVADSAQSADSAKSVNATVDNSIKSTGTNGSMEILNGALSSSSGGGGSCSIDGDGISFTKGVGGSSMTADGISTVGTGTFTGGVEAKGRSIDGSATFVNRASIYWSSSTTNLVVNRSAGSTTTIDLKDLTSGLVYWLHVPRDNIIALKNSSAISTFYCYDSSLTMNKTTDTFNIRSHIRGGARDHGGFSTAIVRSNNNFYVMMDY